MTVYVDSAFIKARVGTLNRTWCHLTADTKEELHAFAQRIGLKRSWFQVCKGTDGLSCKSADTCVHWHYDVTSAVRAKAIAAGAVEIDRKKLVEILKARRSSLDAWTYQDFGFHLTQGTNTVVGLNGTSTPLCLPLSTHLSVPSKG